MPSDEWRLRHRGITHSLLACAAVTWLTLTLGVPGLAIGYVSHVAPDLVDRLYKKLG